ncbi:MAG: acyltransferase [Sandaracinus sp.]
MSGPRASRFAFVDALRGFAASTVAGHHFYNALRETTGTGEGQLWVEPFHSFLVVGSAGVFIFFVLSGFVIAHSVREARIGGRYVLRFALRRSLRLDPPYWVAIAVYLVAAWATGSTVYADVDATTVALNAFYLDHITGVVSVLPVGWTLCLEFQFYLLFVALLALAHRVGERAGGVIFGALFVGSILAGSGALPWHPPPGPDPYFITLWYLFFLGVTTQRVVTGRWSARWLVLVAFPCAAVTLVRGELGGLVGALTAAALFAASRAGKLESGLSHPALQWAGRVSYSLYLIHPLLGNRVIRWLARHYGAPTALAQQLAYFALAAGLSLIASQIFWWLVERPAMAAAQRVSASSA